MRNILIILQKLKWNATYEWLLVRFSAVLIFLYTVYLLWFIFSTNVLTYEIWHSFFSKKINKIINFFTLCSILIHSWIGISHILTDYIKNSILQRILKLIIFTIFTTYLLCGITVVWST